VYATLKEPKQRSGARDNHIGSVNNSMMEAEGGQQQKQIKSVILTQMATAVGAALIAPGLNAMHRHLGGTVSLPYLSFIASAESQLVASDFALAENLAYGSMAAIVTVTLALLCRLQGTSLKQLMRLNLSNPGQVVGRAGLTAAAALAAEAVIWTCLGGLPAVNGGTEYLYLHSGDVLAIASLSAGTLILGPVFEEIVFR
jgi:membrane protease YdiL (CAAX protease family)